MSNLAIIPARGGSKRIPRKNIKDFLGKPIIAYSIEAALKSGLFDKVMVSTDDEEIAGIAKEYGAEVPFYRGPKNSDDFASTVNVLLEVLSEYKKLDLHFSYGCCIYPTAPFVNGELLRKANDTLRRKRFDCVFPVVPFSYPIQRALRIDTQGSIGLLDPNNLNLRSQDLEVLYHDAGQFYFFAMEAFLLKKQLWTENTGCLVIDETKAQDIDNEIDWKLAEIKYKL